MQHTSMSSLSACSVSLRNQRSLSRCIILRCAPASVPSGSAAYEICTGGNADIRVSPRKRKRSTMGKAAPRSCACHLTSHPSVISVAVWKSNPSRRRFFARLFEYIYGLCGLTPCASVSASIRHFYFQLGNTRFRQRDPTRPRDPLSQLQFQALPRHSFAWRDITIRSPLIKTPENETGRRCFANQQNPIHLRRRVERKQSQLPIWPRCGNPTSQNRPLGLCLLSSLFYVFIFCS